MKQDDKERKARERLRALVESYGTNPDRWPAGERRAIDELPASGDAPAWLAEQRVLDELLDDAPDVSPSAALLRRVAEIPARHPAVSRGWLGPFGRLRNALALAAAAAVMGIVTGLATPEPVAGDGGDEWDELSTLALGADISEDLLP